MVRPIHTLGFHCPLCAGNEGSSHFHNDRHRDYYRCPCCHLVHVPPTQFLSPAAERAEYDKHRNAPHDSGYRTFLDRLFIPLNARLKTTGHGLDFGCGPGPTLSLMFKDAGHRMSLYDPFYAPDKHVLTDRYDFITASEVIEHLHDPAADLALLWSILKTGGWLGIMTKTVLDKDAFSRWHYKNDPTHVCFYSVQTMTWLADKWQAEYQQVDRDVFLFCKRV